MFDKQTVGRYNYLYAKKQIEIKKEENEDS